MTTERIAELYEQGYRSWQRYEIEKELGIHSYDLDNLLEALESFHRMQWGNNE